MNLENVHFAGLYCKIIKYVLQSVFNSQT